MMDSSEKNLWNITGCTEYIETVFFSEPSTNFFYLFSYNTFATNNFS